MSTTYKAERSAVFQALSDERAYQSNRWDEKPVSMPAFLTYMRHWLTVAERDATREGSDFDALNQIRKVTALGVACMEQHGVVTRDMVP